MPGKIAKQALILPGVRKCGTTTLFHMLARHSKIAPATHKESQFFSCDAETVGKNLSWYEELFTPDDGSVLLDGSTWYFGAQDAPRLISQHMPDAKVVICLRDPAQRVFSGYLHMKKQIPTREKRVFDEILSSLEREVASGKRIDPAEDELLRAAVENDMTDADYIDENFHRHRFGAEFPTCLADRRFSFRYFGESCYSRRLEPWESTFGDRLMIVYFEDLLSRPATVIEEILKFSHLESEADVLELSNKNITRMPTRDIARRLIAFRKNNSFGKIMAEGMKKLGLKNLGASFRDNYLYKAKETASQEQLERIRVLLTDEYDYWKNRDSRTVELWGGYRR